VIVFSITLFIFFAAIFIYCAYFFHSAYISVILICAASFSESRAAADRYYAITLARALALRPFSFMKGIIDTYSHCFTGHGDRFRQH
jgi:hypothetical protein